MNLKYFIDRPILSVVISVVIVLLGLIGLVSLAPRTAVRTPRQCRTV